MVITYLGYSSISFSQNQHFHPNPDKSQPMLLLKQSTQRKLIICCISVLQKESFLPKSFIDFNRDKQHIRFFTKGSLIELLNKHNFSMENLIDVSLVLPILARYKIIPEKTLFNMGEHIIIKARKT